MKNTIVCKITNLISTHILLLSITILPLSLVRAQSSERREESRHSDYNPSVGVKMVRTYLYTQANRTKLNPQDIVTNRILFTTLRYLIYDYKISPAEYHLFFTLSSTFYQDYYIKQGVVQPEIDKKDERVLKIIREGLRSGNDQHEHYAFYVLIDEYSASKEVSKDKEQEFIGLFYSSQPVKRREFKNRRMLTNIMDNAYKIYLERKNSIQKLKFPKKLTNGLSKSYKTKNQSKSNNKKVSSIYNKNRSEKKFPNQQFLNTYLKGFDYHKSYLGGMKCENTKMEEMYMWRTNLSKAKFKNTTLLGINLIGADCSNIQFIGKKNTNKKLQCDRTSFQGGTFNNTTFEESDFFDTNFTKAAFKNVNFIKNCFSDSNFSDAKLNSVIFESNEFENTNFDKAVLTNITFKNSNIWLIEKNQQEGQESNTFEFTTVKLEPFHQDKETTEDKKTLLDVTIHDKIRFVKNNQTYNNHENGHIQCTFSKKLPPLTSITLLIGGLTKLVMEI